MPSRVIRGEINASRSLSRVSLEADLTFRALLVAVDDYGRCEADPLMLKALLYPRREKVAPRQVRAWVDELAVEGCVVLYVVDGVEYLALPAWEEHRGKSKRAGESKYPDPPATSRNSPGDSREVTEIRPSVSGSGDSGLVDGGGVTLAPDGARSRSSKRRKAEKTGAPENLTDEQRAALRAWCESKPQHRWALSRLYDLEAACLDHFRGKGTPMLDWLATVRTWIRRQPEFAPRTTPPSATTTSRPLPLARVESDADRAAREELSRRREANRLRLLNEKPATSSTLSSALSVLMGEQR